MEPQKTFELGVYTFGNTPRTADGGYGPTAPNKPGTTPPANKPAGPGPTTTAQGRPRWGLLRVDTLLAVLDHLSPPLAAALARPAEE